MVLVHVYAYPFYFNNNTIAYFQLHIFKVFSVLNVLMALKIKRGSSPKQPERAIEAVRASHVLRGIHCKSASQSCLTTQWQNYAIW